MNTKCIEWQKSKDRDGYGWRWHENKAHKAHRVAFAIAHGLSMCDIAGIMIRHECDNPSCVNPDHLLPGSNQDNVGDRVKRNRSAKGERHGMSKLTEDDVREIRKLREKGATLSDIAQQYGVHLSLIHLVASNKIWQHVNKQI